MAQADTVIAAALKERFPWLAKVNSEDYPDSGADVIQELENWYGELGGKVEAERCIKCKCVIEEDTESIDGVCGDCVDEEGEES